ncbi:CBL-interacting protein kinase 10 [Elysia marginata]|uniref:CBL-interacting protein kinase 10 n=1 Tax=Elysia marginata TaxID=1093978 RepID=A0AAV4F5C0_9GAST|nr:CBL-interacting protein kinase 10 [Elysia marginata]
MFSLASDDKEKRMREFYREAQVMQADVYAIGVVIWLLVSSDVPEKGKNYLHSVLNSTDVFLSFDHWMILKRSLEPNPAKRPAISEVVQMMQVV